MPRISARLRDRWEVAERTLAVTFDPQGQPFPFRPGQHLTLTLPEPPYRDDRGNTRTFSIASSPRDTDLLIATRLRGSALKRGLAEVSPGTLVQISGPAGAFTLPAEASRSLVLIAGGIGITPFRSMVKHVVEEALSHRITLLYSNRRPEDAAFLDELSGWSHEYPRFQFVPTMTQPERSSRPWAGRTGRIDAAFLRNVLPEDALIYLAGPPEMVEGITREVVESGAAEDAIRTEPFAGY